MTYKIDALVGNAFDYKGFAITHNIDYDTCECCGTRTTLTWDAVNWVDDVNSEHDLNQKVYKKLISFHDVESLEKLFKTIDEYYENEKV